MAKAKRDERSNARTKTTAIALAKAVVFASPRKAADALAAHFTAFRTDESKRRLDELCGLLIGGCPPERIGELLGHITEETAAHTVHAILTRAVADDEREKVPYYARLLLHVALREKTPEQRLALIRFVGALTKRDLEMLLLVVREMARVGETETSWKTGKTSHVQSGWLAQKRQGAKEWDRLALQHLESNGLLEFGAQPFVTLFGHELVEALTS